MKAISILFLLIACTSHRPKQPDEDIRYVLLSRAPDYRDCYKKSQTYKTQKLDTKYTMILELVVNPDGSIKDSRITNSDFDEKEIHSCVLREIKTLKLPVMKKEYTVKQPLNFYPGNP